jgi:hypothetical protein
VVLRGKKQQQAALFVDDGAGIKTTVSDTELKPSVLSIGKPPSDDHHTAAWGSAPLINDNIVDSDTHSLGEGGDEIHPIHSTPANSTAEGIRRNVLKPVDTVLEPSPESPIVNIGTSESSSSEEEEEEERERRVETYDSHSDDVFLGNSPLEKGGSSPIKLFQSDSKLAYSRRSPEDDSKLKVENDQLPPLPPSRRKRHQRPYTSPGRNSSSCSTDSYTSPVHNRTLLSSTADAIGGQPSSTVRRKPQRSGKATRKGGGRRNARVHPEDNRPPNLKVVPPPPLHSTSPSTLKSSTTLSSSMGMNKRTLSSTDSMSSTFSSTLTPLLTSGLRKGGGSRPGSSAWGFDAEAQLESCFPDRHMQVLVVTWNMQQQKVQCHVNY